MKPLSDRDKKLLALWAVVVMAAVYFWPSSTDMGTVGAVQNVELTEKRVARLRRLAAAAPGRQEILKKVSDELVKREKGLIVAETLAPGASVEAVARRWSVCSQLVFAWRRAARNGTLALPSTEMTNMQPMFVPVTISSTTSTEVPLPPAQGPRPAIELRLLGAVLRVELGTDAALLTEVLRAVRRSAI